RPPASAQSMVAPSRFGARTPLACSGGNPRVEQKQASTVAQMGSASASHRDREGGRGLLVFGEGAVLHLDRERLGRDGVRRSARDRPGALAQREPGGKVPSGDLPLVRGQTADRRQ